MKKAPSLLGRPVDSSVPTPRSAASSLDGNAAVAVTGANRGVGFAAAREVARAGRPVVLLCRSEHRGREAAKQLAAPAGSRSHEVVPVDLASLDSVRRAAAAVVELGCPLAALVNNAAVLPGVRTESNDGFELQLAVNHLAHFLLSCLLMPALQRSSGAARVLTVSSGAHHGPAFDFDDPNYRRKQYAPRNAYQQSKLANVLFAKALARRTGALARRTPSSPVSPPAPAPAPTATAPPVRPPAPAVQSLALGPGVYDTDLLKDYLAGGEPFGSPFPVAAPEIAGPVVADLAIGRPDENLNGGYFDRGAPAAPSPSAEDEQDQERLWAWSAEVTGAPEVGSHGDAANPQPSG